MLNWVKWISMIVLCVVGYSFVGDIVNRYHEYLYPGGAPDISWTAGVVWPVMGPIILGVHLARAVPITHFSVEEPLEPRQCEYVRVTDGVKWCIFDVPNGERLTLPTR